MGAKGQMRRRKLIDAAVALLQERSLQELRVVDIAKAAGTSSSAFYLYFENTLDVALAASGELCQSRPVMVQLLEEPWDRTTSMDFALALVLEHLDYWDRNRALLRVRNLAAEEGDERFLRLRLLSLGPLREMAERQVEMQQAAGRVDPALPPRATAGALIAMIDRVASVMHFIRARRPGNERAVIRSTAYSIAAALGCRP